MQHSNLLTLIISLCLFLTTTMALAMPYPNPDPNPFVSFDSPKAQSYEIELLLILQTNSHFLTALNSNATISLATPLSETNNVTALAAEADVRRR